MAKFDKCTLKMKECGTCALRWDRVETGRRHPSLHRDVRFLASPGATGYGFRLAF
jgi:hypothetical protein